MQHITLLPKDQKSAERKTSHNETNQIPLKYYNILKNDFESVVRTRVCLKVKVDTLPAPKCMWVQGDFDNWKEKHEMKFDTYAQEWKVYFAFMPGRYNYKFYDEDTWFCSETDPIDIDEFGNKNNVLTV